MDRARSGIDKGFCLFYWNLSPRRQFIRLAWLTPLMVGLMLASIWTPPRAELATTWLITGIVLLIVGTLAVPSMVDTYKAWKAGE